jgi:hypothetical protein
MKFSRLRAGSGENVSKDMSLKRIYIKREIHCRGNNTVRAVGNNVRAATL